MKRYSIGRLHFGWGLATSGWGFRPAWARASGWRWWLDLGRVLVVWGRPEGRR